MRKAAIPGNTNHRPPRHDTENKERPPMKDKTKTYWQRVKEMKEAADQRTHDREAIRAIVREELQTLEAPKLPTPQAPAPRLYMKNHGQHGQTIVTVSTSQLKRLCILAIQHKRTLLIVGKPGAGKSEIVGQAAEETQSDLIIDYPAVSMPEDYKGFGFPDWANKQAEFLLFKGMKRLTTCTKSTVWFLDELGQAPDAVQKALMHPILTKHLGEYPMSKDVAIIAATNERWHRAGVTGLLETTKARFDTIGFVEPNIDDWVRDYALPAGLPVGLIAHERFRPEYINMTDWEPSPDMVNSPSPRTITKVGRWLLLDPPDDLMYPIAAGAAGKAYAADLLGFLKMFNKLPSIDRILLAPDKEDIPKEPDVLYAVIGALTGKASVQTIGNIVKFANRMPSQFSVCLINDILAKDKNLINTKPMIDWTVKHSDALTGQIKI